MGISSVTLVVLVVLSVVLSVVLGVVPLLLGYSMQRVLDWM